MRRQALVSLCVLSFATSLVTASCADGGGKNPGGFGGSSPNGSAGAHGGSSGSAGAGSGSAGASGQAGAGSAGSGASGAEGTGVAGSGGGGSGSAGSGSAGSGAAGAVGTAGASGGDAGVPTGGKPESGLSAGCNNPPPPGDSEGNFVKHNIVVTGVDPTFKKASSGGSWTNRVYFLDMPTNYNPAKGYAVIFGGGGCGGSVGNNGNGGGFNVVSNGSPDAIQIGLSYVWPDGAGACFADGYTNTPDLPYFDSILKEVEANYCVDKSKVFVAGYSSGAWESYMLGFARGGVVRGIATAAGGLRMDRPPPSGVPFAALLLTGSGDGENPFTGPTGSSLALDLALKTNKCTGTDTTDWAVYPAGACKKYNGCPAAYPVIMCRGGGSGHTDGGAGYRPAIWTFWSTLPNP
jgi:poly(3-hydroxybutyrate) depolymerase